MALPARGLIGAKSRFGYVGDLRMVWVCEMCVTMTWVWVQLLDLFNRARRLFEESGLKEGPGSCYAA